MHDDDGVMVADLGDLFANATRKIETAALPVAWQVLRTPFYGTVLVDNAGATDSHHRSQGYLAFFRLLHQALEHLNQAFHGIVALRVFVAMPPMLRMHHGGLR